MSSLLSLMERLPVWINEVDLHDWTQGRRGVSGLVEEVGLMLRRIRSYFVSK